MPAKAGIQSSRCMTYIKLFSYFSMNSLSRFIQSAPLLIAFVIFLLCVEFNLPAAFSMWFGKAYEPIKITSMLFFIAYTSLWFFVVPILLSQFIYKQKWHDLGLVLPENKIRAVILIFVAMLLLIPAAIFLSQQKPVQMYYSLNHLNVEKLLFLQLVIFPLYYFFEEFFFRGFLFLHLWQKIKWHSFWIMDILFTLAHLGKPLMEIMLSFPAGIVLACLTLSTRSIYPAIIVHYSMGVTLLLLVNHVI